jgi:hypothetical protein
MKLQTLNQTLRNSVALVALLLGGVSAQAGDPICLSTQDPAALANEFPATICINKLEIQLREGSVNPQRDTEWSAQLKGNPFSGGYAVEFFRETSLKETFWFTVSQKTQNDSSCGEGSTDTIQIQGTLVRGAIDQKSLRIYAERKSVTDWCHNLGRSLTTYTYTRQ